MNQQNSRLVRKIMMSYAMTFIIINLADSLTMMADGMVISRGLGAGALAAVGLADPSYKIISLFSGVMAIGLRSLCAQAMGSGDREGARRIFSAGLAAAAAIVVILTVLGLSCANDLCTLFGADRFPDVHPHLYDYLRGWFTGIPGYILFFVLSPLVSLDGNKKAVAIATFVQSAVNIAGDILSVFVFRTGTLGVGLSTGMAYNLSAVILMLNFFRRRSAFRLFSVPDFRLLPKALHIGLPCVTRQCCRILSPLMTNRVILAIGGSAVMSAFSVKSNIIGFCVIIGNGIAESVGLIAQILYSEKDAVSLRHTVRAGLGLLFTLDTLFSALLFLFAGLISKLFFPADSAEWALAVRAVRCVALSLLLNGCNMILLQYLQGTRKMLQVHLMTLFHKLLSLTAFTLILGRAFGPTGLFAAIPVSEGAILAGYLAAALLSGRGKDFWDAVLLIPGGFGYNSENSCSFSIKTVEEAVAVSEKVEQFCSRHQVDKRTGLFSGLCMEELATNVVAHGFTKDEKKHYCDIRVMIDPEGVVLRIRDNCPYFNIRERYDSLTANSDPNAGLGIRLVFAIAKDVNYINVLQTNTLIIRM